MISIAKKIAENYRLCRGQVTLARVGTKYATAEFIEFYFKDQYIGRADMWNLKTEIIGSFVYVGQKVEGIHSVTINNLFVNGQSVID